MCKYPRDEPVSSGKHGFAPGAGEAERCSVKLLSSQLKGSWVTPSATVRLSSLEQPGETDTAAVHTRSSEEGIG
jgi:hypothetical protein